MSPTRSQRHTSRCRKSERDSTLKLYSPDGAIESAYDDTSQPLYDTRVWLHMYEGPEGRLLPSYCKRTGAAQYMYDFTGAPPPSADNPGRIVLSDIQQTFLAHPEYFDHRVPNCRTLFPPPLSLIAL